MGDSMPRQDTPDYNPSACDHPYADVEEKIFSLTTDTGTVMSEYTFTVCTNCGYIVEQPDQFDFKCVGGWNSPYEG